MRASLLIFCTLWLSAAPAQNRSTDPKKVFEDKYLEAYGLMLAGKAEAAQKAFLELLNKQPGQPEVCYQLARLYDATGSRAEAIEYASKAATGNPGNRWYKILLANLYEADGKYKQAAEQYKQLLAKEGYNRVTCISLAYCQVKAGEWDKALKSYSEIEEKSGLDEEVLLNKHKLYVEMGKQAQATAELKRLAEWRKNRADIQKMWAEWLDRTGSTQEAVVAYERLLTLDPQDKEAAAYVFKHKKGSGTRDEWTRIDNYLRDPSAQPDAILPSVAALLKGYSDKPDDQTGAALQRLSADLATRFADHAGVWALRGDVLFLQQAYKEAAQAYSNSVQKDGRIRQVWEQLLYAHYQSKNWSAIIANGERALDYFPNSAIVNYLTGVGYLMSGNVERAEEYLTPARTLAQRDPALSAAVSTAFGRLLFLKGAWQESLAELQKAADTRLAPPEVYDYLGDTLFKLDRISEAVSMWQHALEAGVRNEALPKKIKDRSL